MKTRKKTKLCLQCNGINPISASHCAYCGAILASEDPMQEDVAAQLPSQAVMNDLFTSNKEISSGPYTTARSSDPFVQDKEPTTPEENINKPLYSVFDQPQAHQMGHLRDELMEKPSIAAAQSSKIESISNQEPKANPLSRLSKLASTANSRIWTEVIAVSALFTGAMLGFLGLLTITFAKEGQVLLSWQSHTAPWLLLVGVGLLVLGWRSLSIESKSNPSQ